MRAPAGSADYIARAKNSTDGGGISAVSKAQKDVIMKK
jgi:hypothetical protein